MLSVRQVFMTKAGFPLSLPAVIIVDNGHFVGDMNYYIIDVVEGEKF